MAESARQVAALQAELYELQGRHKPGPGPEGAASGAHAMVAGLNVDAARLGEILAELGAGEALSGKLASAI